MMRIQGVVCWVEVEVDHTIICIEAREEAPGYGNSSKVGGPAWEDMWGQLSVYGPYERRWWPLANKTWTAISELFGILFVYRFYPIEIKNEHVSQVHSQKGIMRKFIFGHFVRVPTLTVDQ